MKRHPTLLGFCERFTGDSPRLDCSLCGLGCSTIDSFRTHVGGHLEQLALISFNSDEKVEEQLPISPMYHAASADVESFISSQSKFYSNVVFQSQTTSSPMRRLTERVETKYIRKTIQDSATNAGAKRPSMRGRGPSYNYMTDARKQVLNDEDIGQEADEKTLAKSLDQFKPRRTHAPPKNADFIGRVDEMNQIHTGTVSTWQDLCTQWRWRLRKECSRRRVHVQIREHLLLHLLGAGRDTDGLCGCLQSNRSINLATRR